MESYRLGSMKQRFSEQIESQVEAELKSIGKEELGRMAEIMVADLKPKMEEAMVTIGEVQAAVEKGLLQQSIVIAVSALEVYLHDVTVETVSKYRYIEQRFTPQLSEKFDYNHLRRADHDVRRAVGEAAGESYHFYDPRSVRRHLRTLLNREPRISSQADLKRLRSIVAYRNLVAHRAGKIDNVFKKGTGHKGRVGSIVDISQKLVEDALIFVEDIATDVQEGLEEQRAGG